jgi:broad specificity phosphatase PhoE
MFQEPNRRRIYLMRHAEAAYIHADGSLTTNPNQVPLSPTGRFQARKQSAILASIEFDRAICSPFPRTRETAMYMLANRELDLIEAPQLYEIQGGDNDTIETDVSTWINHVSNPWEGADHPEARFLGGETFTDFAARVTPAFDDIVTDTSWNTLLLVLHGGVNRMILNHVLGLPWQGRVSIEQDNCCMNIIDVDSDPDGKPMRYLIRGINITGYDLNKSSIFLTSMEQAAKRISEQID